MASLGLRQFEFRLLANFVEVLLTPQEGLPFVDPGAPPNRTTQLPASQQRRTPNMPERWMSKFSQLMANLLLFIKLNGILKYHG
jgi:hypothetical protein